MVEKFGAGELIVMDEMAAATLFTVSADENVMIPAAKRGLCCSNYTSKNVVHCGPYLPGMLRSGKDREPHKRNGGSTTLLNFMHPVFTAAVNRLISQILNKALINCVCIHNK